MATLRLLLLAFGNGSARCPALFQLVLQGHFGGAARRCSRRWGAAAGNGRPAAQPFWPLISSACRLRSAADAWTFPLRISHLHVRDLSPRKGLRPNASSPPGSNLGNPQLVDCKVVSLGTKSETCLLKGGESKVGISDFRELLSNICA